MGDSDFMQQGGEGQPTAVPPQEVPPSPNPAPSAPQPTVPESPPPSPPPPPPPPPAQEAPESAPQPAPQPQPSAIPIPQPTKAPMRISLKLILPIVAIVVIAAAAFMLLRGGAITPITTTVLPTVASTTTVSQANVANIRNCTTISSSGTYFLAANINTSIVRGACIAIKASNVRLVGNQNIVTGGGPYGGQPPYTYGIAVYNAINVTVTGVKVLQFSYDIYLENATSSTITNSNLTKPVLSGIWLHNSRNNRILNNYVSWSNSQQGGIYLQGGTNLVMNNTVTNNAYYGIVVNSTGNTFSKNKLLKNTADLICNFTSALRYANTFTNSTCSLNDYCGFAQCTRNIPFNLSSIKLTSRQVATCGTISSPGSYSLGSSLGAASFLNTTNQMAQGQSCIRIAAPNVNFTCGGRSISSFGKGISVASAFNVSVSNCVLSNNTYGLYIANSFNSHIRNITAGGSTYGIYFQNSTTGGVAGGGLTNNTYGVYINKTNGIILSGVSAMSNSYGMYVNSGGSNLFSGGASVNNTKADLYCTAATYNSSDDLLQGMACGVTDCYWAASCKQHVLPSLSSYPLTSCQQITSPGNYIIAANVIAPAAGICFAIKSSNVQLSCSGGYGLTGSFTGGLSNSAFSMSGVSNVTISGCSVYQFGIGANATNSKRIVLKNLTISNVRQGVMFRNVSSSTVAGVAVSTYSQLGFNFSRLSSSTVTQDSATTGLNVSSGFAFRDSSGDQIAFNNAQRNGGYGYTFANALGNSFFNNSASQSTSLDYYCAPSSSGIYANKIGVNFGISKNACRWLLVVPAISFNPQCTAISTPTTITLTSDIFYTYKGGTCFSVYSSPATIYNGTVVLPATSADGTVINCNGYTVYSAVGGTFVNIINSTSVKLQNCFIRNFTTPVIVRGPHAIVLNNTIVGANASILISGAQYPNIVNNKISNGTYGIVGTGISYASITNNTFNNMTNALRFVGGSASVISNNTAARGSVGMSLVNATTYVFKGNSFANMSSAGITCTGTSTARTNVDLGGDSCSSNKGCAWMISPKCIAS